jgi:hypothetical protein
MRKFTEQDFTLGDMSYIYQQLMKNQNEIIDFLSDTHPKQFESWQKELDTTHPQYIAPPSHRKLV